MASRRDTARKEKERRRKRRKLLEQQQGINDIQRDILRDERRERRAKKSMKNYLDDIAKGTLEMVGAFNDVKRFYNSRMAFVKKQLELHPKEFEKYRVEEYEKFGAEIARMEQSVKTVAMAAAAIEDKQDATEKMELVFEHMSEMQDAHYQFDEIINKMKKMDEKLLSNMQEFSTLTFDNPEVTEEYFESPDETESTSETTEPSVQDVIAKKIEDMPVESEK